MFTLLQGVSWKTPLAAAPREVWPLLGMNTIKKHTEKGIWVQPGRLKL